MAPLPLLVAALTAALPFLPPADLDPPPGAELVPASVFVLTTSSESDGVRSVDLRCGPSGGSHPRARAACEDLRRSDGDVHAVQDSDSLCTFEYRPVHVTAVGTWRGHRRSYDHVYPNPCALRVDTGSVFQF